MVARRLRTSAQLTRGAALEESSFQPSVYSTGLQPIQHYYDPYGIWPFDQVRRARNIMLAAILIPSALLLVGGGLLAYRMVREVVEVKKKALEVSKVAAKKALEVGKEAAKELAERREDRERKDEKRREKEGKKE